ncbi:MAG: hypothetical protein K0R17_3194 [Rariglobus sp.]|jgi:hypothetical protein|nr:hypothetical protein [Rariglobus sp.]
MKTLPCLLLAAAVVSPLTAATIAFDTAADYTNNFTPRFTSGTAISWNSNSGGSLAKYDASGSASFSTFNTAAAGTSYTIKADAMFTPAASYSSGGLSFSFLTNIGTNSGYAAVFRLTGTNTADFRLFEGTNAATGAIGTQVNTTQTFTRSSGTWSTSTFYTLNLEVLNTGSSISFTGSILTTGGTLLGTFGSYTDLTPSSVANTAVGIRMGVGVEDILRVDNFSVPTTAIPEPSTYAFFGGAGVLAFAFFRRRKQA